jgi:hypothetical protein
MKLNLVNHKEAITWIRQGFWLFKQNPLGFLMLVFMYIFFAQLAILIPVIGVFVVLLLTPALSIGFMTACRQAIQKERILPTAYLAAFRLPSPLARKRVLQLGLIYTACILILSFLASLIVDFELLLPLMTSDQVPNADTISESTLNSTSDGPDMVIVAPSLAAALKEFVMLPLTSTGSAVVGAQASAAELDPFTAYVFSASRSLVSSAATLVKLTVSVWL